MTELSTIARNAAMNCEAVKCAYRQTKDGIVVSFVLHPSEVPEPLAVASLGTRYMLVMVELGDDEKPAGRKPVREAESDRGDPDIPASRPRKPVAPDKRLAQQAGIACADPMFHQFLIEQHMIPEKTEEQATLAVRLICGVKSRAEIVLGAPAADKWDQLYSKFVAWREAPEAVR